MGAAKPTAGGMRLPSAGWLASRAATSINTSTNRPSQKAEKFPATRPERMFSEAPPWREAVTISRTWRASVLVKNLVNSGISAPAAVPQEMITESTHHRSGCATPPGSLRSPSISRLTTKVSPIERAEVIQTSHVNGFSGLNSSALPYLAEKTLLVMK